MSAVQDLIARLSEAERWRDLGVGPKIAALSMRDLRLLLAALRLAEAFSDQETGVGTVGDCIDALDAYRAAKDGK